MPTLRLRHVLRHVLRHCLLVSLLSLGVAPALALDLEKEIRNAGRDGKEWLVYFIDAAEGRSFACCHTWTGGTVRPVVCRPEGRGDSWIARDDDSQSDRPTMRIFLGVEDGRVERLRSYSVGCEVETSWPLTELVGVSQSQSLHLLRTLALGDSTPGSSRELREQALATVSQHRAADAAAVLVDLATPDRDREMREHALFWLSQTGGPLAEETLLAAVRNDPSPSVREHAVFALSELPDGRGVDLLLRVIRTSDDGRTLRQALFWLAESDDPRALETISELLE